MALTASRAFASLATAGVIVTFAPAASYASAPTPRAAVQPAQPPRHAPHTHPYVSPAAVVTGLGTSGRRSDVVQLATSRL